jgi:geranylgeranyl diphosphate synthase type II
LTLPELETVHRGKTGALIRVAARGGAILVGCDPQRLDALTEYAEQLGLAFQITDDLLDVTGDAVKMGKPVNSDGERGKATYPSLLGVDGARAEAESAVARAKAALSHFGVDGRYLAALADFVLSREQ